VLKYCLSEVFMNLMSRANKEVNMPEVLVSVDIF